MADRIITMRTTLYDLLQELGSKKEWGHIKSQIGMVRSPPSLSLERSLIQTFRRQ